MPCWIIWSEEASRWSVALLFFCLFFVSRYACLHRNIRPGNLGLTCLATLIAFCLAMGAGYGWMQAMLVIKGHVPAFPVLLWPWRTGLLTTGLLSSFGIVMLLRVLVDFRSMVLGCAWSWWLLSLLSSLTLPGAAGNLVLPSCLMTFLAFWLVVLKHHQRNLALIPDLLVILLIVPFSLIPAVHLEEVHGYGHLFFAFILPPLALFSFSLLPLMYWSRQPQGYPFLGHLGMLVVTLLLYNLLFELFR